MPADFGERGAGAAEKAIAEIQIQMVSQRYIDSTRQLVGKDNGRTAAHGKTGYLQIRRFDTGSPGTDSGIRGEPAVVAIDTNKVEQQAVCGHGAASLKLPVDQLYLVERIAAPGVFKLDPSLPHGMARLKIPAENGASHKSGIKGEAEVTQVVGSLGFRRSVSAKERTDVWAVVLRRGRAAEQKQEAGGD